MLPSDQASFGYNSDEIDVDEYFKKGLYGGREYLLKDPPETLPQARKEIKRYATSFFALHPNRR